MSKSVVEGETIDVNVGLPGPEANAIACSHDEVGHMEVPFCCKRFDAAASGVVKAAIAEFNACIAGGGDHNQGVRSRRAGKV